MPDAAVTVSPPAVPALVLERVAAPESLQTPGDTQFLALLSGILGELLPAAEEALPDTAEALQSGNSLPPAEAGGNPPPPPALLALIVAPAVPAAPAVPPAPAQTHAPQAPAPEVPDAPALGAPAVPLPHAEREALETEIVETSATAPQALSQRPPEGLRERAPQAAPEALPQPTPGVALPPLPPPQPPLAPQKEASERAAQPAPAAPAVPAATDERAAAPVSMEALMRIAASVEPASRPEPAAATAPATASAPICTPVAGLASATDIAAATAPRADAAEMPRLHLQQPGWEQALAQRVTWMVNDATQRAQIHVNPPELGPIEVRIEVQEGEASVRFASPHAPVRESIEAAMPRLREMLLESGLNLLSVDVSAHGFARQRPQLEESPLAARPMRDGAAMDAAPRTRAHDGVIDFYA